MARWAERSDLLPARAMMIASGAWRWSSFTHALALSREDYSTNVRDGFGGEGKGEGGTGCVMS